MEDVVIVYGTMEYKLMNAGSRSEGKMAILFSDDGKEYALYRPETYPIDDAFFAPFHGLRIGVKGTVEEDTGYVCVTSILSGNGEDITIAESKK